MAVRVGVIAEDQSDVDVVAEVLGKIARRQYSIKAFLGHGSGRILSKCPGWARVLSQQGCSRLILIQDLDMEQLQVLRMRLTGALGQCPIARRVVVIPVREIEAWLLADEVALGRMAKTPRPPRPVPNPERLMRPKEFLRDLLYRLSNRRLMYVNTVHNKQLASHATLARLRWCGSFHGLENFAMTQLR